MNYSPGAALPSVLVVESDSMLRRIIVGVVRELALAQPHEALSVELAERALAGTRFDAILIGLTDDGAALKLVLNLRSGHFKSPAVTPVAVTSGHCDASLALQLRELEIRRVLLKPFKVKGVIDTIAGLCAGAATAA